LVAGEVGICRAPTLFSRNSAARVGAVPAAVVLSNQSVQPRSNVMDQMLGGAIGGAMGLLMVAVVGLVIGVIAKLLMPGKDPGGWLVTILLGIAGSWVGGFVMSMLGLAGAVPALIGAVIGAMLLLFAYRLFKKN